MKGLRAVGSGAKEVVRKAREREGEVVGKVEKVVWISGHQRLSPYS